VVFRYGGARPCVWERMTNDRPNPSTCCFVDRMKHEVARIAPWIAEGRQPEGPAEVSERPVAPPEVVIRDHDRHTRGQDADPPWSAGISEIPSFSENGVLCDQTGVQRGEPDVLRAPSWHRPPADPTRAPTGRTRGAEGAGSSCLEPLLELRLRRGRKTLAHAIALGMLGLTSGRLSGPLAPACNLFRRADPTVFRERRWPARVRSHAADGHHPVSSHNPAMRSYRKRICFQKPHGEDDLLSLDNVTRELVFLGNWRNKITSPYLDRPDPRQVDGGGRSPNRMIWVCSGKTT